IHARDPGWISDLKKLIDAGKVEFIGAGYSQMIGPLVPAAVTEKNLALGTDVYRRFGLAPRVALVNEQAYAAGLVGLYQAAGYDAILMDWDNPSAHHPWPEQARFVPQRVQGTGSDTLGLIWTDTVAFQMLQRFCHGDITQEAYLDFIAGLEGHGRRALCLYASDGEVFDYRPGRYRSEEVFDTETGSEWDRLSDAFLQLKNRPGCRFVLPSALAPATSAPLQLETPDCPVPVKKQRKYNLSRWAVTGRDDIALNAACERIYRGLTAGPATDEDWRELCFLWSSDFRTHITENRWQDMKKRLAVLESRFPAPLTPQPTPQGDKITARHIAIDTGTISATLDRRRGLTLDAVRFGGSPALIGKLPLGVFADIAWQADWYTGDCVFEAPGEHKVTDLEWCTARRWQEGADTLVYAYLDTPKGPIEKFWRFHGDSPAVDCEYVLHWSDWGKGALRLGHITLLPAAFDDTALALTTHNGGKAPERFALAGQVVEHGAPVSFLVSASQGLGMTEGWAILDDGHHFIRVEVDRGTAPLLGLLTHRPLRGGLFCQLVLSALELDDTRKPAALYEGPRRFRFSLSGGRM
ncbi:MAG: hypothetical protein WCD42_06455, partial [Rhizomicrobium sp.]